NMSEPILERLSLFTPDAGRLDRDALLFAAGRASARPNRGWMTLASLLAGTQALSLALLLPHSRPSVEKSTVSIADVPAPSLPPRPRPRPRALRHPGSPPTQACGRPPGPSRSRRQGVPRPRI